MSEKRLLYSLRAKFIAEQIAAKGAPSIDIVERVKFQWKLPNFVGRSRPFFVCRTGFSSPEFDLAGTSPIAQ